MNDDARLQEFNPGSRFNANSITNFLQIKEAPSQPGTYIGIDAPEFATHAAGQIISVNGAPATDADQMAITYVTHPDTASTDDTPSANHSGLYRNPLPMADGLLVAVHTSETRADRNDGTIGNISRGLRVTEHPVSDPGPHALDEFSSLPSVAHAHWRVLGATSGLRTTDPGPRDTHVAHLRRDRAGGRADEDDTGGGSATGG